MTKACSSCNQPGLVSDKFCASCGAAFVTSESVTTPVTGRPGMPAAQARQNASSVSRLGVVALISMLVTLAAWWSMLVRGFGLKTVLANANTGYLATDFSIAAITAALMTLATGLAAAIADGLNLGRLSGFALQVTLLALAGFVAFVLLSNLFFNLDFRYQEGTISILAGAAAAFGASWLLARGPGNR